MKVARPMLFWLIAPLSLALWLILVTPTHWIGFETPAIGTALLLLTTWVGLGWSTRMPAERLDWVRPVVQSRPLIFLLVLSNLSGCLVTLWLYRRDRL
jgi:hypothetical protein